MQCVHISMNRNRAGRISETIRAVIREAGELRYLRFMDLGWYMREREKVP